MSCMAVLLPHFPHCLTSSLHLNLHNKSAQTAHSEEGNEKGISWRFNYMRLSTHFPAVTVGRESNRTLRVLTAYIACLICLLRFGVVIIIP